jgi:hypothetical protein
MQNEDKPALASETKNPLSDDDIIEFAETVLADLDSSDAGYDEDKSLVEDDDDIIDLTEVADKPESSDDILELTEDGDMGLSTEEDILELKDIAEKATGEDEVAFELEDDIEDLMIEDDAVIEVDDEVDDPADAAEEDADDREIISEPYDFADEEEPFDLSSEDRGDMASSDQEDENAEFDFEPAAENLTDSTDESPLSADAVKEETLPESEDRVPEEYPAEDDPMKVALERQPLEDQVEDLIGGHIGNQIENPAADGQKEKLELTEADRRLLEAELSLDIEDDASTDTTDDRDAAAPAGQPLDDTIDPGRLHRAESGETADAENVPASPTAEAAQPDLAETSGGGMRETFDFDFDETAEDVETAESEPPITPAVDFEELSVESLLADSDATDPAEQHLSFDGAFDGAEGTTEAVNAGPAEPSETEFAKEMQAVGASEMNLDPLGSPDPHDGLTAADAMSIPVVGLSAQNRADDDAPADKLNEPLSETLSGAQLEAVVEQAVKKLFGEKIETMLSDAIDKAVAKEIDRLKTLILGDLDHDR